MKRVLTVVCSILIIFSLASCRGQKENNISPTEDLRLSSYEANLGAVQNLALLYSMNSQSEYDAAKAQISMSKELQSRFFPSATFTALYKTAPIVQVDDIEYAYTGADSVSKQYLLVLRVTRENGSTVLYNLVATYSNGMLMQLDTY